MRQPLQARESFPSVQAMPPATKKKAKLPSPPVQELSALDRLMMAGEAVEAEEGLLEAKTEEDDDKTDPPSNPAEPVLCLLLGPLNPKPLNPKP